jgi:hypothetical protein
MLYQITATRTTTSTRHGSSWTSTTQIPTFYLDSNMQGIVAATHAEKIARDILGVGDRITSPSPDEKRRISWQLSVHAEPFVSIHD